MYDILLSLAFNDELECIYKYITENFFSYTIAERLKNKILEEIKDLRQFPNKFSKWGKLDYRKFTVDNFIIFYYVDEEKKQVIVLHIFYKRRDIDGIL